MTGMKEMTKEDLYEFIEQHFSDVNKNKIICCLFYTSAGYNKPQQQCIMFKEELENE